MTNALLKHSMWVVAAAASFRGAQVFLITTAAIVALNIFSNITDRSNNGLGTISTFVWCYLAFAAHAIVLKNASGSEINGAGRQMFRFIWRTVMLSFIPALFIIPFILVAINSYPDGSRNVVVLVVTMLTMPIYLIEFALFGSMLPAVVMDDGYKIRRTLNRGSKTFFSTAGHLVIGPGLTMTLGFLVLFFFADAGSIGLIPEIIATLIFAYSTVLTAVILSRAYVIGEEKLGPPDGPKPTVPVEEQELVLTDSQKWTDN